MMSKMFTATMKWMYNKPTVDWSADNASALF